MPSRIPDFEPRLVEQAADALYRKAASVAAGAIVAGICIGAAFGAVPLTSLGDAWPIPRSFGVATMLTGGLFGGLIGYVIGAARAFGYRMQAQMVICQLRVERHAAIAAGAAQEARAALAALAEARAAEPAPAPAPRRPEPALEPTTVLTLAPPVTPPVSV